MNTQITGNDLIAIGYPQNSLVGIALRINRKRNGFKREEIFNAF